MGIIGSIRKNSWIAVALVGIAIVAFIVGDLTKNNNGPSDMGEINGKAISYQVYNARLAEQEDVVRRQQGIDNLPSDLEYELRNQVWQLIVGEQLFGEQYKALGLTVSQDEMNDMYTGNFIHAYIRQSFTNPQTGQLDINNIRAFINNFDNLDTATRLQWVELQKAVRDDRLQSKYLSLVGAGFYMPTAIAEQVAAMSADSRNVAVVSLPYSEVPDGEATLTDADYESYYKKHRAEFRIYDPLRDVNYIAFTATPSPADMQQIEAQVNEVWDSLQVADDREIPYLVNSESDHSYDSSYVSASTLGPELEQVVSALSAGQFVAPRVIGNEWVMAKVLNVANRPDSLRASVIQIFNDRIQGITRTADEAHALADSVAALLRAGSDFDALAAEYSDNKQQSDLGWMPDGYYGYLNETIIGTPEGGTFVLAMPRDMGYVVGRVTGKTTPSKKYRIARITREILPSDETLRQVEEQARSFASNNRSIDEMAASAMAAGMQMRSQRLNSMDQNISGFANTREIVQWAFNKKTTVGTVADQVYESENTFIIVGLREVFEPGYAKLSQVRDMIDQQVRLEKKGEILLARAEQAVKGGNQIADVAAGLSASIDTVENVSLRSYFFGQFGMEPKMQGAVAAAGQGLIGPIQGANGVYVAAVIGNNEPTGETAEAAKQSLSQDYMQKARMIATVLRQNAKVVDNRNRYF